MTANCYHNNFLSVISLTTAESSITPSILQELLLEMVRKRIAGPLRVLLGHGLRLGKKESSGLALVSCTSSSNRHSNKNGVHPWLLFVEFYRLQSRDPPLPYLREARIGSGQCSDSMLDGMLGQWFRVLAHCDTLQQSAYEPWSYMTKHELVI
eukprot:sb/3473342/